MGELYSSLTAVIWALAVILFKKSGESVHPIALNTFKNSFAVLLFIPTMLIFRQPFLYPASLNDYAIILASGALGIGIADTLFFMSLNKLGAGLSAIVDCLYGPFVIGLSILWLGDTLTLIQILGSFLIISAVLTATNPKARANLDSKNLWLGILWGVLAMAAMAVGIVMMKPILNRSPLLWTTEIRLIGGSLILYIMLIFHPNRKAIINSCIQSKNWKYTLSGSFFGAYCAMILWLAGMKYTQTSIAAVLNQTSNIFIFIFAALILKEKITPIRIVAIILAVTGAILVSFC